MLLQSRGEEAFLIRRPLRDTCDLRRAAARLVERPGEYGDLFLEEYGCGEVSRSACARRPAILGGWSGAAVRRLDAGGDVRHHASGGLDPESIGRLPERLRGGSTGRSSSGAVEAPAQPAFPSERDLERLASYLEEIEGAAFRARIGSAASPSSGGLLDLEARAEIRSQAIAVATSEGELSEDQRDWVSFSVRLRAAGRGGAILGATQGGGARDPDRLRALHPPGEIGARLVRALAEADEAAPPPSGETVVILGPGAGGILFHEACGHALEGDRALRDRSAFAALLGETIGPSELTLVDDPTLDGLPGSRRVDDEGWAAARTVLIDAGRVAGLLLDRTTALRAGTAPTGSARRESYRDLPLPRMTNTFATEGRYQPEEILAAVARGVYIEELGAGRVDTATADFIFGVRRGFLMAGGRKVAPLGPCVVSGNGLRAVAGVKMIGADLRFDSGAGECGKDGQRARAAVGQPTILIDGLMVRPA